MTVNSILLYAHINAPDLSDRQIDDARSILEDPESRTQADLLKWGEDITKRTVTHRGQSIPYAFNRAVFLPDRYLEWARQHLSPDCVDARIVSTPENFPIKGPHIDITRHYNILYLIESGGTEHRTCFYKDLTTGTITGNPGHCQDNMDLTEVVGWLQIPLRTWTLINTNVLHGVENIPQSRKAFQFSLNDISRLSLVDPTYHTF